MTKQEKTQYKQLLFAPFVLAGVYLVLLAGFLAIGIAGAIVHYVLHSIGQWPDY